MESTKRDNQGADSASVPARGQQVVTRVREPGASGAHVEWLDDVYEDREQVEHRPHRADDILSGGDGLHAGATRSTRQVREQDTDAHQDRAQFEDAITLPARSLLH